MIIRFSSWGSSNGRPVERWPANSQPSRRSRAWSGMITSAPSASSVWLSMRRAAASRIWSRFARQTRWAWSVSQRTSGSRSLELQSLGVLQAAQAGAQLVRPAVARLAENARPRDLDRSRDAFDEAFEEGLHVVEAAQGAGKMPRRKQGFLVAVPRGRDCGAAAADCLRRALFSCAS